MSPVGRTAEHTCRFHFYLYFNGPFQRHSINARQILDPTDVAVSANLEHAMRIGLAYSLIVVLRINGLE